MRSHHYHDEVDTFEWAGYQPPHFEWDDDEWGAMPNPDRADTFESYRREASEGGNPIQVRQSILHAESLWEEGACCIVYCMSVTLGMYLYCTVMGCSICTCTVIGYSFEYYCMCMRTIAYAWTACVHQTRFAGVCLFIAARCACLCLVGTLDMY
jgi:hypothetical protein